MRHELRAGLAGADTSCRLRCVAPDPVYESLSLRMTAALASAAARREHRKYGVTRPWRVMSRHHVFQLWIAGFLLGATTTVFVLGGPDVRGWPFVPSLMAASALLMAVNAVYFAPRAGDNPDSVENRAQ